MRPSADTADLTNRYCSLVLTFNSKGFNSSLLMVTMPGTSLGFYIMAHSISKRLNYWGYGLVLQIILQNIAFSTKQQVMS